MFSSSIDFISLFSFILISIFCLFLVSSWYAKCCFAWLLQLCFSIFLYVFLIIEKSCNICYYNNWEITTLNEDEDTGQIWEMVWDWYETRWLYYKGLFLGVPIFRESAYLLSWSHFLTVVADPLIILVDCPIFLSTFLNFVRMSMSIISFLTQLDPGILCLQNVFLWSMMWMVLNLELTERLYLWFLLNSFPKCFFFF